MSWIIIIIIISWSLQHTQTHRWHVVSDSTNNVSLGAGLSVCWPMTWELGVLRKALYQGHELLLLLLLAEVYSTHKHICYKDHDSLCLTQPMMWVWGRGYRYVDQWHESLGNMFENNHYFSESVWCRHCHRNHTVKNEANFNNKRLNIW